MRKVADTPLWLGHALDGRNFAHVFGAVVEAVVELAREERPEPPPRSAAGFLYRGAPAARRLVWRSGRPVTWDGCRRWESFPRRNAGRPDATGC